MFERQVMQRMERTGEDFSAASRVVSQQRRTQAQQRERQSTASKGPIVYYKRPLVRQED